MDSPKGINGPDEVSHGLASWSPQITVWKRMARVLSPSGDFGFVDVNFLADTLAVATRISHSYQVLLHDDRIIIPQGNFKFSLQHHHTLWRNTLG